MSWLELLLFIVIIVLLIFSAVYSVKAAAELAKFDYKSDKNLDQAHKWLTYASIVGWIGVGLIILGTVLTIYIGSSPGKFLTFFSLAVVISLGILCALGWDNIDKASKDVTDIPVVETAKHDAIVATLTSIIGGIILLALFIYLMFHDSRKKKKIIYVNSDDTPSTSTQTPSTSTQTSGKED